jgi:hypothetical protein
MHLFKQLSLFVVILLLPTLAFSQISDDKNSVEASVSKKPNQSEVFNWQLKLGGQAVALADFDDESGKPFGLVTDEPVRFGIHRASLMFTGKLFNFVSLRTHIMAMPMSSDRVVQLYDLEAGLEIHPLFNIHIGRFKKGFTSQYTDYWGKWNFFDVSPEFKYTKGRLGLAGRGEGIAIKGHTAEKQVKYMVGAFNGLEDALPWQGQGQQFNRTDESIEIVSRIDARFLNMLHVGAGMAVIPVSTLSASSAVSDDITRVRRTKRTLWAYAFNIALKHRGMVAEVEYIGHVDAPLNGEAVQGGGVNADVLYGISLPVGTLQPGVRYAVFFPNFDDTDTHTQTVTGALNWFYNTHVKVGLEVGTVRIQPTDTSGTQGLMQLAIFH